MDLRWIEGEIEELSAIWEELRYKRPRFEHGLIDANDGESLSFSLSSRLSAWKELLSQVEVQLAANAGDDDADDCVEADIDAAEIRIMDEVKTQNATIDSLNNTTTTTAAAASPAKEEEHDSAIDYEFGMCLVGGVTAEKMEHNSNDRGGGGSGGMSVWDRYASKSLEVASTTTTKIDVPIICNKCGQEKNGKKLVEKAEDALPEEVLSSLEVIHARCLALHPKIEKLRKKSKERDLITKKPRIGEKTRERVKVVLRSYAALELGVSTALLDDTVSGPGLISTLRSQIQQHSEKLELEMYTRKSREQEEADRLAQEAIRVEELARQRIALAERTRREEEEMLARRAHEARVRRMEEEWAAEESVRTADRELLAMVPNIGPDGVRAQIDRMKVALVNEDNNNNNNSNNNVEGITLLSIALSSLRDMFIKIVRHPEEMKYRTVRRDHPKFIEDIGRHVGGREILIAAGFRLENIEGVPCLYSKEPDVEKDMDGWSIWFDNLKKTLEVIEEQMM